MKTALLTCTLFALIHIASFAEEEKGKRGAEAEAAFQQSYKRGQNYYGYCMFCHARDGKGTRLNEGGTMAPPLAGSPRVLGPKEVSINILLHGMTGEVDGVNYEKDEVAMKPPPEMMVKDDEIMAGLLNYIRNSWGNEAPMITPEEVKAAREAGKNRKKPWTIEELEKAFPAKEAQAVKKPPLQLDGQ